MDFGHKLRVLHAHLRSHAMRGTGPTHKLAQLITKEPPRSKEWPIMERRWKKEQPCCQACGSPNHVQVHHKKSFKLDPALELHDGTDVPPASPPPDGKSNYISLCMDTHECHLKIGHGGSFAHGGYNPNVERDAADAMHLLGDGGASDDPVVRSQLQRIWKRSADARVETG